MLLVLLYRGLRRRCPACGGRRLFESWFGIVEQCPDCGLVLAREDGYWLGAMIVNIAMTEFAFLVTFVGGMIFTWPEVPWWPLLVVSVAVNALVPLVFQPVSRTVWVALDLGLLQRFEPADTDEERRARNAV